MIPRPVDNNVVNYRAVYLTRKKKKHFITSEASHDMVRWVTKLFKKITPTKINLTEAIKHKIYGAKRNTKLNAFTGTTNKLKYGITSKSKEIRYTVKLASCTTLLQILTK